MNRIPISLCEFRKEAKTLLVSSRVCGGFPAVVEVESKTGKVVKFVKDEEAAIAAEFWDGEECHYKPVEHLAKVAKLVIHNF